MIGDKTEIPTKNIVIETDSFSKDHGIHYKRTEVEDKKIGYLIKDEDRPDIEAFLEQCPQLTDYIPVAIIGEGTFSTVYKAIDVNFYNKDNSSWIAGSRQDPYDPARLLALFLALENSTCTRARKRYANSRLNQNIKDFIYKNYNVTSTPNSLINLEQQFEERPPVFVAIKRINATSGPKRIAEELSFIKNLKGLHNVLPIISACRWEDQELLATLTVADIASYMRLLLESLAHVHANHIIHRDVKPSNFMFARDSNGLESRGLLVDFGLAQLEEQDLSKRTKTIAKKTDGACPENFRGISLFQQICDLPRGYVHNDPRAQMKASRAGTRGFRAPEVLFKVAHQTVSIDVWSAGVILLTLLTRRYPFFQSTDDSDALVELASIFGNEYMAMAANEYDRVWSCNIPTVPEHKLDWRDLCSKLNKDWKATAPDEAYDLLDRLLDLNFKTRVTAAEALDHPFLRNF